MYIQRINKLHLVYILSVTANFLNSSGWTVSIPVLYSVQAGPVSNPVPSSNSIPVLYRVPILYPVQAGPALNSSYCMLRNAVIAGDIEAVSNLLKRCSNVNVNIQDQDGVTLLHEAVFHGHQALIQLLLDKGANVNIQDRMGYTPLLSAFSHKHSNLVKLLLKRTDIDVNIANSEGFTPLHFATSLKEEEGVEIVQLLLEKGCLDIPNKHGKKARDLSSESLLGLFHSQPSTSSSAGAAAAQAASSSAGAAARAAAS